MRSATDLYVDKVKEQLICGRKRKTEIIQQLSTDVAAFESALDKECTMELLEAEFGTPQKAAEAALSCENIGGIRKSINKKKTIICVIALACIVALLILLGYLAHDRALKEAYADGRFVVTLYEHAEGAPPPEPDNAQIYGD